MADTFPDLEFSVPSGPASAPRGTVVLLHGWMMHGDSMLPWALRLADPAVDAVAPG